MTSGHVASITRRPRARPPPIAPGDTPWALKKSNRPVRHIVLGLDEDGARLGGVPHDMAVVDDLLPDVDGRAEISSARRRLDRPGDARAETHEAREKQLPEPWPAMVALSQGHPVTECCSGGGRTLSRRCAATSRRAENVPGERKSPPLGGSVRRALPVARHGEDHRGLHRPVPSR